MFGQNPIRSQELRADGSLWVQEVFATIQGEGPLAGSPAVFVRVAGCNLRCYFCDTDFESGTDVLEPEELLRRVEKAHTDGMIGSARLIVLTGGEPFRQNIAPFVSMAINFGWKVQIETAGTLWVPNLTDHKNLSIVCSPKTGSINAMVAARCFDYKYIVSVAMLVDEGHGIPMMATQSKAVSKHRLYFPPQASNRFPNPDRVWLQACDEQDEERNKANLKLAADLCMRYGHRLSIQMHKIVGVP